MKLEGRWREVWLLFIGNGPYHPRGMVPAWRPRLDSGLLDVRWMRADVRLSRLRVAAALLLGALGHSRVYGHCEVPEIDVELAVPGMLATDGEIVETSGRYTFRVASGRFGQQLAHRFVLGQGRGEAAHAPRPAPTRTN